MPRIAIGPGPQTIHERMFRQLRPELLAPAQAMADAVHRHSILPWRTREAVRYVIARINGCLLCQEARLPAAVEAGFTEAMYEAILSDEWRTSDLFSPVEKLAIEFTERFALDHESIDDNFWTTLHESFSDSEILDLAFVAGRFLAFGRLTHVLGLDDACEFPGVRGVGAAGRSLPH